MEPKKRRPDQRSQRAGTRGGPNGGPRRSTIRRGGPETATQLQWPRSHGVPVSGPEESNGICHRRLRDQHMAINGKQEGTAKVQNMAGLQVQAEVSRSEASDQPGINPKWCMHSSKEAKSTRKHRGRRQPTPMCKQSSGGGGGVGGAQLKDRGDGGRLLGVGGAYTVRTGKLRSSMRAQGGKHAITDCRSFQSMPWSWVGNELRRLGTDQRSRTRGGKMGEGGR
ncbi:unnamed protein product [Calypogeia fissa]